MEGTQIFPPGQSGGLNRETGSFARTLVRVAEAPGPEGAVMASVPDLRFASSGMTMVVTGDEIWALPRSLSGRMVWTRRGTHDP